MKTTLFEETTFFSLRYKMDIQQKCSKVGRRFFFGLEKSIHNYALTSVSACWICIGLYSLNLDDLDDLDGKKHYYSSQVIKVVDVPLDLVS